LKVKFISLFHFPRQTGRDEKEAAGEGDAGSEDRGEVDGVANPAIRMTHRKSPLLAKDARNGAPTASSGIRTKLVHDSSDVVFLEEADCGDASRSGFEAGVGVRESDSA
jgi:hypothetical protein